MDEETDELQRILYGRIGAAVSIVAMLLFFGSYLRRVEQNLLALYHEEVVPPDAFMLDSIDLSRLLQPSVKKLLLA